MPTKTIKKKVSAAKTEAAETKAPWSPPAEHRGIGIRTVDKNYQAYGQFQWPKTGYVKAPDWDKTARCGGGLHMLPDGDGDWGLMSWGLDAIAQVCEYDKREAVSVDGDKVKVPQCNVIKTGSLYTLLAEVVCNSEVIRAQVKDIQSATPSGDSAKNASSGDYAKNASSGHQSVCVAAGYNSKCMVGKDGALAITWHDGKRPRITVGYAGEDGIEAGVFYVCDAKGKLVKA